MKTKLFLLSLLSFYFCLLSSQVPQGFNYQAAARDNNGFALKNKLLTVMISIQPALTSGNEIWIETHSITTDDFGVITLVIGDGSPAGGTATNFSDINWGAQTLFLRTQIDQGDGNGYLDMGTSQLWSVPYSMVAKDLKGSVEKLGVKGTTTDLTEALFEVKNFNDQTVFAVYGDGVRAYVDNISKGAKGGFAIGGFGKGQDYLVVDPGNIKMYIDDVGKGAKGGFAIGGYGKGGNFFNVDAASDAATISSQNRILWYPYKNAFLAGRVQILDPADVGVNSFATGFESKAKGEYSQAMGYRCVAAGGSSVAIGYQSSSNQPYSTSLGDNNISNGTSSITVGSGNITTGGNSVAIGRENRAVGPFSVAIGYNSETGTEAYSVAIGYTNKAYGPAAVALGGWSLAEGSTSMAVGYGAVAHGDRSFSMGFHTQALGGQSQAYGDYSQSVGLTSTAFGWLTTSNGTNSVAMGEHSTAQARSSLVIGQYNLLEGAVDQWNPGDPAFVIGNGSGDLSRSNAFTILKNGNVGIGYSTPASALHIEKPIAGHAVYIKNTYNNGASGKGIYLCAGQDGVNTGADLITFCSPSGAPLGAITQTGSNSINMASASDIRLKENILNTSFSIASLMKIKVRDFNFISDNSKTKITGFVAQELFEVYPDAVSIPADKKDYWGVDYGRVTPLIVKSVQDQQQMIESLKDENQQLKAQNDNLKQRLEKIEAMLEKNNMK